MSFSPDLVAQVDPIGMSIQDIANRASPNMKFLRLVQGQVQRHCSIDSMTARRALLNVFNLNDESHFLSRQDAERIEQYVPEPGEPELAPSEERYGFLQQVLPQACATYDPLQELGLVKAIHTALANGRQVSSADAGDALMIILALNERAGFLSDAEAERVEMSLLDTCNHAPWIDEDEQFLYDMTLLTLEYERQFSQRPAADTTG
ncbi:hypothetical protein [uncultured Stenotrophomonas sp.]|uniref:hypothetical protein n=1 Tax=uncultured Stenotrophomonas sp. TaxID=165438 RepID=UPI0025FD6491|nr:hypothetical protein [uncultured Stenotrophomonas sp.]